MDEMNIRSSLLQGAIANALKKIINQKTGYSPDIQFNDALRVTYDGDKARLHLNTDIELKKADLEALLKKIL